MNHDSMIGNILGIDSALKLGSSPGASNGSVKVAVETTWVSPKFGYMTLTAAVAVAAAWVARGG